MGPYTSGRRSYIKAVRVNFPTCFLAGNEMRILVRTVGAGLANRKARRPLRPPRCCCGLPLDHGKILSNPPPLFQETIPAFASHCTLQLGSFGRSSFQSFLSKASGPPVGSQRQFCHFFPGSSTRVFQLPMHGRELQIDSAASQFAQHT